MKMQACSGRDLVGGSQQQIRVGIPDTCSNAKQHETDTAGMGSIACKRDPRGAVATYYLTLQPGYCASVSF